MLGVVIREERTTLAYTGWRRKNVLNIRMRCEQSY